jgi:hypothetical protein
MLVTVTVVLRRVCLSTLPTQSRSLWVAVGLGTPLQVATLAPELSRKRVEFATPGRMRCQQLPLTVHRQVQSLRTDSESHWRTFPRYIQVSPRSVPLCSKHFYYQSPELQIGRCRLASGVNAVCHCGVTTRCRHALPVALVHALVWVALLAFPDRPSSQRTSVTFSITACCQQLTKM